MANDLYFTQTKLKMLGKEGIATPDEDGYYTLVIGGLNTSNNTGSWYYTAEGAKELFGPGSLLHRKIANGCLRAEVGHPKQRDGQSMESYLSSLMDIDMNNVCAHIKDVWLDEQYGKQNPHLNNPALIAIMGKVKPSGPKASILKEALESKHQNVCFSIRSLADEQFIRGKRVRKLLDIVTFDFVNEGGVLVASKWDSPATESIDNDLMPRIPVVRETLQRIAKPVATKQAMFSLESVSTAEHILKTHLSTTPPPIYRKW